MKKLNLLFLLLSFNCFAARIYVNINVTGGNNDGTSWANAYTELQEALINANTRDDIWIASGTYHPDWNGTSHDLDTGKSFLFDKDITLYGGFNGTETSILNRDWIANKTILSGDLNDDDTVVFPSFSNTGDNTIRIINSSAGITTTIDGFEIKGGNSISSNISTIFLLGTVNMVNCIIYNNQGHPVIEEPLGQSKLENCLIFHNFNASNGTIFTHDIGTQLINCALVYNHGTNLGGFLNGAYMVGSSIQNTIIWGNTATNTIYTPEQINCNNGSSSANSFASFENNILENFSATQHQMTSATNLALDPLFVDSANLNFSILESSPAKDAGNNSFSNTTVDLYLNIRQENGAIDIGMFEVSTTLSVDNFNYNQTITIYPNPVKDILNLHLPNTIDAKHINYTIYGLSGKIIYHLKPLHLNTTIDLTALDSGSYILEIINSITLKKQNFKIFKN